MAGITTRVRMVEDAIPPISGTAIRFITSEPVPVLHKIGNRLTVIAVTVINFGRTRSTAPSIMALRRSARLMGCSSLRRCAVISARL